MRARHVLSAGTAVALTLGALAFGPVPEGQVAGVATRDGSTVTFAGTANLADPGEQDLFAAVTGFADSTVADAAGIDLAGGSIAELEDGSGLRFTWHMDSDLPSDGVPEGVRYNWVFTSGGQTFQLQVKRSNLASVTTAEAPLSHVTEAAEGDWWFQLRGACAAAYANPNSPIAGCYHLGFFEGEVDTAAGTVSMELPYEAKDEIGRVVAGQFRRGQPIVAEVSAGTSVAATFQAVVSNATVSQYFNGWGSYHPGTSVAAALGSASGPTGSYKLLDTEGDGDFAGSLDGAGSHVWVRACSGYELSGLENPCVVSSMPIG